MKLQIQGPTSRYWALLGVLLLLLAWQIAAQRLGSLLMATPWQTLQALVQLFGSGEELHQHGEFHQHGLVSLGRIGLGVGLGCTLGFCLGVLAGLDARLRGLLEPLRWLLMAIPPVVVVVLAMLWFGLGSAMVVFITVLMLAPGMYVNTVKGMLLVDRGLIEMAHVYRLGPWQRLRYLYVPALAAPLTAALLIAACGGVRLVVMAEVLGADSGAGFALANARSTFDSAGLYAWTLLLLLLVAGLEFSLLQPLQRYLSRWQVAAHA